MTRRKFLGDHPTSPALEYDGWADIYDLVHDGLEGDCEFYVAQAKGTGGKTLEIGCGTGRIAIPMAMTGVDVLGMDISEPMLAECRRKLELVQPVEGRLRLVCADMRDFSLRERFDFIAMPYRTFMHCLTPADQLSCLTAARAHLKKDGRFILNLWAARPSVIAAHTGAQAGIMRLSGRYDSDEGGLVHYCASDFDEYLQELHEEHTFYWTDEDGAVVDIRTLSLTRAWLTAREMLRLVQLAGFEVDALLGDFDGGPFLPHSTEMVWVLRQAASARGRK